MVDTPSNTRMVHPPPLPDLPARRVHPADPRISELGAAHRGSHDIQHPDEHPHAARALARVLIPIHAARPGKYIQHREHPLVPAHPHRNHPDKHTPAVPHRHHRRLLRADAAEETPASSHPRRIVADYAVPPLRTLIAACRAARERISHRTRSVAGEEPAPIAFKFIHLVTRTRDAIAAPTALRLERVCHDPAEPINSCDSAAPASRACPHPPACVP